MIIQVGPGQFLLHREMFGNADFIRGENEVFLWHICNREMAKGDSRFDVLSPFSVSKMKALDKAFFLKTGLTSDKHNRSDLRWDNFNNLLNI